MNESLEGIRYCVIYWRPCKGIITSRQSRRDGRPVTGGFIENIVTVITGAMIVSCDFSMFDEWPCFPQVPCNVSYDSLVHFLVGVGEPGPPSLLSTSVPRNL